MLGILAGLMFAGAAPSFAATPERRFGEGDTLVLRTVTVLQDTFFDITDFTADPLGNVYVLTGQEVIEKYDASGKKRTRFSQNRLGAASGILAGNALKLLVWYPDFRTALFLDRNLTQLGGALSLIDAGYPEVRTIGLSADGNIWLYDEVAFKLKKISPEGALIVESQQLNSLFDGRLNFQQIMDDGVHVVAMDSVLGFFVFDIFGQFQRQIGIDAPVQQFFLENSALRWIDTQRHLHTLKMDVPGSASEWVFPKDVTTGQKIKLVPGGVLVDRNGVVVAMK